MAFRKKGPTAPQAEEGLRRVLRRLGHIRREWERFLDHLERGGASTAQLAKRGERMRRYGRELERLTAPMLELGEEMERMEDLQTRARKFTQQT